MSRAGDSSLFATGLASGQPMMPTAALACCMTALAVEAMVTHPLILRPSQQCSALCPRGAFRNRFNSSCSHFVSEALKSWSSGLGVSRLPNLILFFFLTDGLRCEILPLATVDNFHFKSIDLNTELSILRISDFSASINC